MGTRTNLTEEELNAGTQAYEPEPEMVDHYLFQHRKHNSIWGAFADLITSFVMGIPEWVISFIPSGSTKTKMHAWFEEKISDKVFAALDSFNTTTVDRMYDEAVANVGETIAESSSEETAYRQVNQYFLDTDRMGGQLKQLYKGQPNLDTEQLAKAAAVSVSKIDNPVYNSTGIIDMAYKAWIAPRWEDEEPEKPAAMAEKVRVAMFDGVLKNAAKQYTEAGMEPEEARVLAAKMAYKATGVKITAEGEPEVMDDHPTVPSFLAMVQAAEKGESLADVSMYQKQEPSSQSQDVAALDEQLLQGAVGEIKEWLDSGDLEDINLLETPLLALREKIQEAKSRE